MPHPPTLAVAAVFFLLGPWAEPQALRPKRALEEMSLTVAMLYFRGLEETAAIITSKVDRPCTGAEEAVAAIPEQVALPYMGVRVALERSHQLSQQTVLCRVVVAAVLPVQPVAPVAMALMAPLKYTCGD